MSPRRWPWWAQVIALHLAVRAFDALAFAVVARTQAANPWTGAAPSYLEYTSAMWDADWYRQIAEHGYPDRLPVGVDGEVRQNPWAFFPLMPGLVRMLGWSGLDWQVAAPLLALALGTVAMLVVHQLVAGLPGIVEGDRGRLLPLATVAVLTTFASAPVLQVAYTEAVALLLLASVLLCLQRRAYWDAVPLVLAAGLSRGVAAPVAALIAVHAVVRWRAARRGDEPLPTRHRRSLGVLLVAAAVAVVAWPVIAGLVTGRPDAFTRTQAAWRAHRAVVPLLPWIEVPPLLLGGWGVLVALAVIAVIALAVVSRTGSALRDMRTWTVVYVGYLLLATEPGTSQIRFLLLAFPLAVIPAAWALRRRRWHLALAAVVVVGLLSQVAWIALVWRLVPPSGWPP